MQYKFQQIIAFVKANALKVAGGAVVLIGLVVAAKKFRNGKKRHLKR